MLIDGARSRERGAEGTAPPLTRRGQRPGLLLPSSSSLLSTSLLLLPPPSLLPSSFFLLPSPFFLLFSSSSSPLPFSPSSPAPPTSPAPTGGAAREGTPGTRPPLPKMAGQHQPGTSGWPRRGGSGHGELPGSDHMWRCLGFWHPTSQLARNLLDFLPQPPHAITDGSTSFVIFGLRLHFI